MGEKRRLGDACDTGWGEAAEEGPRGEGGEKVKDKRKKETKHMQEGLQGKGKGETVEKRKRSLSEGAGTAGKAQRGQGVGGAGASASTTTEETSARSAAGRVSTIRRVENLQPQPHKSRMQGMR